MNGLVHGVQPDTHRRSARLWAAGQQSNVPAGLTLSPSVSQPYYLSTRLRMYYTLKRRVRSWPPRHLPECLRLTRAGVELLMSAVVVAVAVVVVVAVARPGMRGTADYVSSPSNSANEMRLL